jgi:chemotaxis protein MotD
MGRSEQAESISFEPAARSASPSETAGEASSRASPDNSAEPAKAAPRVTVLAQQSIPAPVPQTSVVLVESIAASNLLEPARNTPALDAIHASATHASAQSLKLQLHPAELGMVTATLRFAGAHLSIELQVENHEAYRRLSNDSETIVSSLRDLGYDIDRVTILQPSLASTPAGRSDTGASMPSPQGRAAEQFGSGAPGAGNGGSGGKQPEEGGNAGRKGQQNPAAAREHQGSGIYI